MLDTYYNIFKKDDTQTISYYTKSVNKTEQQKYLEKLLGDNKYETFNIADVACGGGTLSYHLKNLFPNSNFYLSDYLDAALEIAKKTNKEYNFNYKIENIYSIVK